VGRLGLGLVLVLRQGLGLALGLQLRIGIGFSHNHSWSSTFTPRRNHSLCLWNMPALYGILTSSRRVMHLRESRGGLLAWITSKYDRGTSITALLTPASP